MDFPGNRKRQYYFYIPEINLVSSWRTSKHFIYVLFIPNNGEGRTYITESWDRNATPL